MKIKRSLSKATSKQYVVNPSFCETRIESCRESVEDSPKSHKIFHATSATEFFVKKLSWGYAPSLAEKMRDRSFLILFDLCFPAAKIVQKASSMHPIDSEHRIVSSKGAWGGDSDSSLSVRGNPYSSAQRGLGEIEFL